MQTTFIGHRRFLWFWLCLAALLALAAVYATHEPIGGKNGSTPLGLAYGVLAAAGMLFLMWYGVRKRYSYRRGSLTLKAWLGPHVWLGVTMAFLVPMHCGFHIGWTLHALSYLLMLLTIASGIWGAYAYLRFPSQMQARREGLTTRHAIEQIEKAEAELARLAKGRSEALARAAATLTVPIDVSFRSIVLGRRPAPLGKAQLSELLATLPAEDYQAGLEMTGVATRRLEIASRMLAEAATAAKMRLWLFVHLPLSVTCLLAVAAHVFWVMYFRGWAR